MTKTNKKLKIGDVVQFTDKCPLYIQRDYTPESRGKIIDYSDGLYSIEMPFEIVYLKRNCIKPI